jgi:hypothetical protein
MPRWARANTLLACLVLAGCLGETPERARILAARSIDSGDGPVLEIEQALRFSPTMLEALGSGIPLRLVYVLDSCVGTPGWRSVHYVELRYAPLRRAYELHTGAAQPRRFARRSALLAALDRIRVPRPAQLPADCERGVLVALDLVSLPTPLRFPAFLRPDDWRMVSPSTPWQAAS